nr:alpha/beta hydrolase fold domain-containing protein [Frigoribacterium endophyticum]
MGAGRAPGAGPATPSGPAPVDDVVAGVPVRKYAAAVPGGDGPEEARSAPVLVWAHGGGFFRGGLDQPEAHEVASALARRGVGVVTVDYRLTPWPLVGRVGWAGRGRTRFPGPVDDVSAVWRSVAEATPGGALIGGASAGACLAAAATLRAIDEGAAPRGVVLGYGFFHPVLPVDRALQRSVRGHRRLSHSRWGLDLMNRNYAGTAAALADRHAFAGGQDLAGFPRTLMVDAEADSMRASGDAFARELAASGAELERHVLPGTRHAFLDRPRLTEFGAAVELVAGWCLRG